jgi:hypothetical protein
VSVTIRPYQPQDRADVRRIFLDTAFHGRSYRHFFDDGEWLADIMTAAYTDAAPQSVFVAENENGVIGYLTGTLDSSALTIAWRQLLLKRVIVGFFKGGTWKSARAWKFFLRGFWSFLHGEQYQPHDLWARFPAHFHINISDGQRGGGTGRRLAEAFFEHMRENGVLAVHIRTSTPEPRQRFFESIGFRILMSRKLRLWSYLGEPPLHLITYGQNLKPSL